MAKHLTEYPMSREKDAERGMLRGRPPSLLPGLVLSDNLPTLTLECLVEGGKFGAVGERGMLSRGFRGCGILDICDGMGMLSADSKCFIFAR